MQVHDTPLVINAKGATVAVTVGAGGADVYYGASYATASRVNGGTLAAAGSTFQLTAPAWVVRSDQSQAPAADLSFVEQAPAASSAGSSAARRVDLGGNVGGGYTLTIGASDTEVWLVNGTINADCIFTITGLPAGKVAQVHIVVTKDATSTARAISVDDGSGAQQVVSLTQTSQPAIITVEWDGATSTAYLEGATNGINGTNGNTILSTTGAPASGVGVNGDYAIDTAAKMIYGPKASGSWPAGVSLQGTVSTDIQIFTANGTWTKPTGVSTCRIVCIGPGGGGGSGRRGAAGSIRSGGNGGAGGGFTERILSAANLGATEAVVVGTGGAGGIATTTDDTNGAVGANGTANTSFGGTKVRAAAGIGGSAGSAGGSTANLGGTGAFAGGNGGANSATGGAGGAGTATTQGAAGGGAGGGITTGDVAAGGGAGGLVGAGQTTVGAGGTSGGVGGNGVNGIAANAGAVGSGGGGGGASTTAAAGKGGNGGQYGAGGGGGGASVNGNNSGAGGNGGDGICVVISW